jgi:NAD+ kinase
VTPAPPDFRRIGLVTKPVRRTVPETLRRVAAFLGGRQHTVRLDTASATLLDPGGEAGLPLPALVREVDLLVVIGGDGTLLHAARAAAEAGVPVAGINLGRLGFLTDISPARATESLARILDGQYVEDPRCLLEASLATTDGGRPSCTALNDVVLHKWNTARLVEFETYIDGRFVNSQRSDGLVVSTPTGSTAYALSGGGPLLQPGLDALVLVPLCPHTLSNRPLVVAGSSVIDIRVCGRTDPAQLRVTCDGQDTLPVCTDEPVRIRKHARAIRLIHPAGHDHFELLRAKLGWSESPR